MERNEINHLCDIMTRLIPFPVYVLELDTGHILYASESHSGEFIGGYPASDAVDKGWRFLHEIISPETRPFIDDAINVIRDFYTKDLDTDKRHFTISFNCDVLTKNKALKVTVNHKFIPFITDSDGKTTHIMGVFFPGNIAQKNTLVARNENEGKRWIYENGKWENAAYMELSDMEKIIMTYSIQGMSIKMIARNIGKSEDTVKKYRKAIFTKLGVHNIAEAITIILTHKML